MKISAFEAVCGPNNQTLTSDRPLTTLYVNCDMFAVSCIKRAYCVVSLQQLKNDGISDQLHCLVRIFKDFSVFLMIFQFRLGQRNKLNSKSSRAGNGEKTKHATAHAQETSNCACC